MGSVPTKDMGDKKCVKDFSRGISCMTVHKMTKGTKDHIPWQILNHYTLGLLADICHLCCYNHHENLGYCFKSDFD
jgi:hypothetical protein